MNKCIYSTYYVILTFANSLLRMSSCLISELLSVWGSAWDHMWLNHQNWWRCSAIDNLGDLRQHDCLPRLLQKYQSLQQLKKMKKDISLTFNLQIDIISFSIITNAITVHGVVFVHLKVVDFIIFGKLTVFGIGAYITYQNW